MNSPAHDIAAFLAGQGIGTFAGTADWGIYVSKEPAAPDNCITVYDTPGFEPDPDNGVFYPAVQVRVRGNGYQEVYARSEAARDELIIPKGFTQGGTRYVGVWQQGSIESLGYDDNDRAVLVMNFNIIRQEA